MFKKFAMTAGVAALAFGLLTTLGTGVASASRGKGPPTPVTQTGTVACQVNAVLTFNPPLQATASTSSSVRLNAQLTRCTGASGHGRTTGHVSGVIGSIPSNSCAASTITPPAITGLAVRWTPPSRVASTVSASAVSASTATNGHGKAQLMITYTGGSVTGSFATSAGTVTVSSNAPVSALAHACSGSGLGAISFKGTATL